MQFKYFATLVQCAAVQSTTESGNRIFSEYFLNIHTLKENRLLHKNPSQNNIPKIEDNIILILVAHNCTVKSSEPPHIKLWSGPYV